MSILLFSNQSNAPWGAKQAVLTIVGTALFLMAIINSPRVVVAKDFVDFNLLTTQGASVNSADYVNEPMVIYSWAPWCAYCTNQLVEMANLVAEYGDAVNFFVISRSNSSETKAFLESIGLLGKIVVLIDEDGTFSRSLRLNTIPSTIFVKKDRSYFTYTIPLDEKLFRSNVELLLQEDGEL